jgi:hypothetical protein
MSIFVDRNLKATAGIFFHIYHLTLQVVLSVLTTLAHSNEDDNHVLAHLMPQLFTTDPLIVNLIVLTFLCNSSMGGLGAGITLEGM